MTLETFRAEARMGYVSAGVQRRNESLCMPGGSTHPKSRVPFKNWNLRRCRAFHRSPRARPCFLLAIHLTAVANSLGQLQRPLVGLCACLASVRQIHAALSQHVRGQGRTIIGRVDGDRIGVQP